MHADHIRERSEGGSDSIKNLRLLCEDCHKFRHGWFGWLETRKSPVDGWTVFEVVKRIPNRAATKYLKLKDSSAFAHFRQDSGPNHFQRRVRPHWKLERAFGCGCRIEVRQYFRPPYCAVNYKYPDMLALCPRHSPKSPQHEPTPNDVMPQQTWSKLRPKIFKSKEWEGVRTRLAILIFGSVELTHNRREHPS